MTAKELAALLNGREYGNEITQEEAATAKEAGLVVVFGESDDLMEFYGAIDDEVGCFNGGTVHVGENGLFEIPYCANKYGPCKYVQSEMNKCPTITALWDKEGIPWSYQTEIPHETFEIFEDGEKYCQGIVFSLADLRTPKKWSAEERGMFNVLRGIAMTSYLEFEEKQKMIEFITDLEEASNHAG